MKNYLGQTFGLTILVTAILSALSFLPKNFSISGYSLRSTDIFSDVRPEAEQPQPEAFLPEELPVPDTTAADTTAALPQGPLPPMDSALYGHVIEDYTPEQLGLSSFFQAVDSITAGNRVRIAFYGDSFVEGDIVVGDLRDTLQSLWGGNGVGYVPITSEVARFKRTLTHSYSGWDTYSIVKNSHAHVPFGLNGYVYYPRNRAEVRYEGANYFNHCRQWSETRLFYSAAYPDTLTVRLNDNPASSQVLHVSDNQLGSISIAQPGMRSISFELNHAEKPALYGVSLEGGPGIYIDNFSVRGNTGGKLRLMRPAFIQQFDAVQQYDLVVVQLGLNAVTNTLQNIRWYEDELDKTLAHLKNCFPNRPILLLSVPDRGGKIEGELMTMPAVHYIAAMQRKLARKHGLLFYDLFHGMGGPGAMISMADRRPALANKDYTHLTHAGGRIIGRLFAKLFIQEQQRYRTQYSDNNVR